MSEHDVHKPAEIARLVEAAGIAKVSAPVSVVFTLGVLAGAFIALGAAAYTVSMTGVEPGFGPTRVLGGVVFSLGLILVIVGGAELFTGNALIVMAWTEGRITGADVLKNWSIVFVGNTLGAVGIAFAMSVSGLLDGAVGATAATFAEAKATLGPLEGFMRGALCNALVCLAVWLSFAARSAEGKILAVLWPVTAFVALGFEHSIANLYLLPAGALAGAEIDAAGMVRNLVPVTIGNIVGGAGGVATAYRFAYLGERKAKTAASADKPEQPPGGSESQ